VCRFAAQPGILLEEDDLVTASRKGASRRQSAKTCSDNANAFCLHITSKLKLFMAQTVD
jgi:hypothetical protein